MRKFTESHEWAEIEGDTATVGITKHAAEQLGDVVFVELPEVGKVFDKGADMAVVESVKAASDVYAPVSGEVVAVNQTIVDAPETVNAAPDGDAWFVRIKLKDTSELDGMMDEAKYAEHASA